MSEDVGSKKDILRLMEESTSGDRSTLESFYTEFLECDFIIIKRASQAASPREPRYPTEFFPFLGIRGGDKTWLPIFTGPVALNEWSTQEMESQTITGREVLERIPNEWWLALNPGSEISKEFSPWEISTLRSGPDGIKAAAEDQMPSLVLEQEYSDLKESEFPGVSTAIKEIGAEHPSISFIKAAKETSVDSDGKAVTEKVLVGVSCDTGTPPGDLERIRTACLGKLSLLFIGGIDFDVLAGIGESPLSLGRLKAFGQIYQKKASTHLSVAQLALIGLALMYITLFALNI
jgi:hypothetical protein